MIPEFDETGNLPPGIWPATIEEVGQRFATNAHRKTLFQAFVAVVNVLQAAHCPEVHLDGSFICSTETPGDYDMCYEPTGMQPNDEWRTLLEGTADERKAQHLGDIFIRMPVPPFFHDHVEFWQTDRDDEPKGIIRIEL